MYYSHRARDSMKIDFRLMHQIGCLVHEISHSESSGNPAVKIYAQHAVQELSNLCKDPEFAVIVKIGLWPR